MSILKLLGVRSSILSFLEVALFFLLITPIYFSCVSSVYAVFTKNAVTARMFLMPYESGSLAAWSGILPIWMWIVAAAGYLLLVTLYWAPGETTTNETELRGLVIFAMAAFAAGCVWLQLSGHYLSNVAGLFWTIVTGNYKPTA